MATSNEPEKMKIFGEAEKWAFREIARTAPELAERWLQKIEAVDWNNYLTPEEADGILAKIMNQDGSVGPMWTREQIKGVAESIDGKHEQRPYFNSCALYATMNMLASDHMNSARAYVKQEQLPEFFYHQAKEKLQDIDRPNFIRSYFNI